MTKALDAAGAEELAKLIEWLDLHIANNRGPGDIIEVCVADAELIRNAIATLRRQLEEADAVVWGGPEVSWSWYVEACDRHLARSASSSPRGMK